MTHNPIQFLNTLSFTYQVQLFIFKQQPLLMITEDTVKLSLNKI